MQIAASVAAQGCPPWLPCGKYQNLIIPDSGYDGSVNGTAAAAGSLYGVTTSPLEDDPSSDIEQRIAAARLLEAKALANRLQFLGSNNSESPNQPEAGKD